MFIIESIVMFLRLVIPSFVIYTNVQKFEDFSFAKNNKLSKLK